jgi:hypothetical protein
LQLRRGPDERIWPIPTAIYVPVLAFTGWM